MARSQGDEEDSGNETETTSRQFPSTHIRRRVSFVTQSLQGNGSPSAARCDAEDPHTISLGLHRSFSIASLHHFLVDSVYGHVTDGETVSKASPLFNAELHEWEARHRTRSHPVGTAFLERSHSSTELAERAKAPSTPAEGVTAAATLPRSGDGYFQTVSYWRRVFQSLVM